MGSIDFAEDPHKRFNPLTGEWVLVSPHRMKRPWQGKVEAPAQTNRPAYDPTCYLCPGNKRADGETNPDYTSCYAFTNDFAALLPKTPDGDFNEEGLLVAKSQRGTSRVICFSPRHDVTLPEMEVADILKVVQVWVKEFHDLESNPDLRYIQIFENKGEIMGCSNPHPHGQIWALNDVPAELEKETVHQKAYFAKHGRSLLSDYLRLEGKARSEDGRRSPRIVVENEHFVALVPFWAVWPFETMIISRRQVQYVTQFTESEQAALADVIRRLTIRYDNLFQTSFPYSAGMHQAPVNEGPHPEWHWHMHFYPPLLRSATVKKFMVGYEMLAGPQRDITAEWAAERLQQLSEVHYKHV
jgi:UDPglucose--hexose-1-phosphate uridylyltransferase